MGNLKMSNNTIIITGSDGETAEGLINYFSARWKHVIGLSRFMKTDYNQKNVFTMHADMLNISSVENAISEIINKYDSINAWINCVGGFSMGNLIEDENEWDEMHSINFITCLNGCRAIIPYFKKHNHGCIINFGSKAAIDGFPTAAPYLISKSSVHKLTKLISMELNEHQVRCNAILPGIIDTPSNRTVTPDEDFNQWESIDNIADKINSLINSNINGQLVTL